jgi:MFS family permease
MTTPDEETPFLAQEQRRAHVPWSQITLLLIIQLSEPLTSQIISPFAPEVCPQDYVYNMTWANGIQFVRKAGITHGDETRVGYYVGLMVGASKKTLQIQLIDHTLQHSIFFATEALTILHWSRMSDLVGRKPIILTGLFGLSLSMYGFGMSRTYWAAVVRFVSRQLNLDCAPNAVDLQSKLQWRLER